MSEQMKDFIGVLGMFMLIFLLIFVLALLTPKLAKILDKLIGRLFHGSPTHKNDDIYKVRSIYDPSRSDDSEKTDGENNKENGEESNGILRNSNDHK